MFFLNTSGSTLFKCIATLPYYVAKKAVGKAAESASTHMKEAAAKVSTMAHNFAHTASTKADTAHVKLKSLAGRVATGAKKAPGILLNGAASGVLLSIIFANIAYKGIKTLADRVSEGMKSLAGRVSKGKKKLSDQVIKAAWLGFLNTILFFGPAYSKAKSSAADISSRAKEGANQLAKSLKERFSRVVEDSAEKIGDWAFSDISDV